MPLNPYLFQAFLTALIFSQQFKNERSFQKKSKKRRKTNKNVVQITHTCSFSDFSSIKIRKPDIYGFGMTLLFWS